MTSGHGEGSECTRVMSFPPTRDDWNFIRPYFVRLYIDENQTLNEVRKVLEEGYGFRATRKMCNQRINDWNIHKNYKASEKEEAARLLQEYKADGGKTPIIMVKGRPAQLNRIQRHCKTLFRQNLSIQSPDHNKIRSAPRDFHFHKSAILGSRDQSEIINQNVFNFALLDPTPPVSTPSQLRHLEVIFFKIDNFCKSYFESKQVPNGVSLGTIEVFQCAYATTDGLLALTLGSQPDRFVYHYLGIIRILQIGDPRKAWQLLDSFFDSAESFLLAETPGLISCIILMARHELSGFPGLFQQVWHYLSNLSCITLGSEHPITVLCHFIGCSRSGIEMFERIHWQICVKTQTHGGEMHDDTIDAKLSLCSFLIDGQRDYLEAEKILDQVNRFCDQIKGDRYHLIPRCLFLRSLAYYKRDNSRIISMLLWNMKAKLIDARLCSKDAHLTRKLAMLPSIQEISQNWESYDGFYTKVEYTLDGLNVAWSLVLGIKFMYLGHSIYLCLRSFPPLHS